MPPSAASASPQQHDVMTAVIDVAQRVLQADGFAVWRLGGGRWEVRGYVGISDAFARSAVTSYRAAPAEPVDSDEPLVFEDVRTAPSLSERLAAYEREGIRSMAAIPLMIGGVGSGALVLYYRTPHCFAESEIATARALGHTAAAALTAAELYEEAQRREADAALAERRATFLADAGTALATSLDYEETLRTIVRLAVPRIADWCALDIVAADGSLQRLAVMHVDPAKVEMAQTLAERYADPDSPYGMHHVIRTARPVILPVISDEMIVAAARGDQERIALVRAIGLSSYICVPLVGHSGALGTLSFVSSESSRHFTDADLRLAQDVASRAALAVENARAYAEVQRANHLKDEFLATLSHELRTPLNAVLGYSRMLKDRTIGPDKQARAYEIIERNAGMLGQIVADILDVSRIVVGKVRLETRPVELEPIVGDAVAAILPAAEAKGVAVSARTEPSGRTVLADADRLQQVFWNLVSNAVKFTPHGGRVDVIVRHGDDETAVLVRDTGVGIAADFLPHVFERFRQADPRTTREHGGLGLGLAIAKHLVEMHGGTIEASSDGLGKGASFQVVLPKAPRIVAAERAG